MSKYLTRPSALHRALTAVLLGAMLVVLGAAAYVALHGLGGQELVRIRNAMLYEIRPAGAYDWTPDVMPRDFLRDRADAGPVGSDRFAGIDADPGAAPFERSLQAAQTLVRNKRRPGIPIKASTAVAFEAIVAEGRGYCADYTQVMNAIMTTMDVPVREWGMSFDRYSGDGHAFSEVFDAGLGKWVFIDAFHSFYVTGNDGVPLSVAEFRRRLLQGDETPSIVPISEAKFAFRSAGKALDYYRRGADAMYLWWGTNVMEQDHNALIRRFSLGSRSLGQVLAMATGLHPQLVIAADWQHEEGVRLLRRLRTAVWLAIVAGTVALGVALPLAAGRLRRRRKPG